MSERTTQAFREACHARLAFMKQEHHGPETNPPRHIIKSYQYQIEKALDSQWGELMGAKTIAMLEATLHEYWRDQHGPYSKVKPEVIVTSEGFVVNLGDFQIAEYGNARTHL
jgi:hypothetical protein